MQLQFFLILVILTVVNGNDDCEPLSALLKGLPFSNGAVDKCLDGSDTKNCDYSNYMEDIREEVQLNVTYTFYGRPYDRVFVCENGLISFEDHCEYPTILNSSSLPLIVGFWGEDIELNKIDSGFPYSYYNERSENIGGCFQESKDTLMKYLNKSEFGERLSNFSATNIFVSTWSGIHGEMGTVQIVIATEKGKEKNDTYALLISNITYATEDVRNEIGFSAGYDGKYFPLSRIAVDSNIGIPGVYVFRIDQEEIVEIRVDKNDFIEVYRDDDWRSVCDDYWTCEDADVACRQLGFLPFGASTIRKGRFTSLKEVAYWMDDVHCEGHETSLFDCPNKTTHNCGQSERAGVRCLKPGDVDIHLWPESSSSSGAVQLKVKGTWGFICYNHWTQEDARVACKQLGLEYTKARVRFYPKRKKGKMYWLDHVRCEGDEDNLLACQYIKGSDNCAKMAGVICDG